MTARSGLFAVLLLILVGALPLAGDPVVVFFPQSWQFGSIFQGDRIQTVVTVKNTSEQEVGVSLLPTCTCLAVTPAESAVAPGAEKTFVLIYDSSDDQGITRKDFVIRTRPPGLAPSWYSLTGVVRAERRPEAAGGSPPGAFAAGPAAGATVTATYYYTPGCRSCEQFLSVEVPRLSRELRLAIIVVRKDILQPALYEELAALAASHGDTVREIPVLAVGSVLLQGDAAIRRDLAAVLGAAQGRLPAPVQAPARPPFASLSFLTGRFAALPIAAAGLIDGVNPCAFTTLIFLLASLALAGRGRRDVLLIGSLFSLSVFLTYLGIGLGLFAVLRAAAAVSLVSMVLRWVLVAVVSAFAAMSVYDYFLIRRGRPAEILLQLPSALKRQVHTSIRTRVRTAALAGSSLVLGFLVSVFEFACTGQVYLPMLAWLVRMRQGTTALALLLLYNFCFIVPLLAVFGASYFGVSSGKVTGLFQAHMGKVKLALAAVFAVLAVFTLVG
ncbi:MAG TPA: DUF1573 domain-containing protein [Spirochaetia bacterium]|nr:DUF1573 domain-containing protein [Spirochaetia bacterium]